MWNFLWSWSSHRTHIWVNWTDWCAHKKVGGLNLVDLEEALWALSAKWFIKALGAGASPLQVLLKHRLLKIKPQECGTWPATPPWSLFSKFKAPKGSWAWGSIVNLGGNFRPWLKLFLPLTGMRFYLPPCSGPWSSTLTNAFGVSHLQAAALMKAWLTHIRDLWKDAKYRFYIWEEIVTIIPALPNVSVAYNRMLEAMPRGWLTALKDPQVHAWVGELMGFLWMMMKKFLTSFSKPLWKSGPS
jgi:hypothetical protein